jgi:putative endonuclease
MPHYVYILKSLCDNKYYIGETADVDARLEYHNAGRQRSTKHRVPFILVYTETFTDRAAALQREKQIKNWKGGNSFKALIGVT